VTKNIQSICLENKNLVETIAKKYYKRYKYGGLIELNDLIGMGFLGLIDAATRFDQSKKVDFKAYASYRVRGEILDQAKDFLWPRKGVTTVNMEASKLEIMALQDEKARSELLKKELLKIIEGIIARNLNNQEKRVIDLKYRGELKTTQIAKLLKVSPGRICQIEKKALKKIKRKVML